MFDYIDSLRKKSPEVRRRYALGLSIGIILVIIAVWATATYYENSNGSLAQSTVSEDTSPLQSLKQNLTDGYNQVKGSITGGNPFTQQTSSVQSSQTQSDATSTIATSTQPNFDQVIITDPGN